MTKSTYIIGVSLTLNIVLGLNSLSTQKQPISTKNAQIEFTEQVIEKPAHKFNVSTKLRQESKIESNTRMPSREVPIEISSNLSYIQQAEQISQLPKQQFVSKAIDLLQKWAQHEPKAALIWAKKQKNNNKTLVIQVFRTWSIHNAAGAAKALSHDNNFLTMPEIFESIGLNLAKENINLAVDWYDSLPLGHAKSEGLKGILNTWSETNIQQASQWATRMKSGFLKEQALAIIAEQLLNFDVTKAVEWSKNLDSSREQQATLTVCIEHLSKYNFDLAAKLINELPLGQFRSKSIEHLASHFSEKNHQVASYWASSLSNQNEKQKALSIVSRTWVNKDFDSFQRWLRDLEDHQLKYQLIGEGVKMLLPNDLNKTKNLITMLPENDQKFNWIKKISSHWGKSKPREIAEWVYKLENNEGKTKALEEIVDIWAQYDLDGALEFLNRFNEEQLNRGKMASPLLENWSKSEPDAAYQWIQENMKNGIGKRDALTRILNQVSEQDPELAANWLREHQSSNFNQQLTRKIIEKLSEKDMQLAKQYVADLDSKRLKKTIEPGLIKALLKQSPNEALEYVSTTSEDQKSREILMDTLFVEYANLDAPSAAKFMAENEIISKGGVSSIVSKWGRSDEQGLLNWMDSLTNDSLKQEVYGKYVRSISYRHPEKAASHFHLLNKVDKENAVNRIMQYWGRSNPENAANWLVGLPTEITGTKINQRGFSALANQWYRNEPNTAMSWGLSMNEGEQKSLYFNQITTIVSRQDRTKALGMVDELPWGSARDGAIKSLLKNLKNIDDIKMQLVDKISDEQLKQSEMEKL